jgi:hypothetical protein
VLSIYARGLYGGILFGPAPEPREPLRANPTDPIHSRLANPGLVLPMRVFEKNPSVLSRWLRRLAVIAVLLVATTVVGSFLLSRADGPIFVFSGGPLRAGQPVELATLNWQSLDSLHELEMEIVEAKSSLTLWFSVHDDVPYVACDLDCVGGMLTRWPQQIDLDNHVVVRINGKRAEAQLVHVPHGTAEYTAVRAGRSRKYAGEAGGLAAAETTAHSTVVNLGEVITGRAQREEPGDRLYRLDPP